MLWACKKKKNRKRRKNRKIEKGRKKQGKEEKRRNVRCSEQRDGCFGFADPSDLPP
jgi:hypothetical protein